MSQNRSPGRGVKAGSRKAFFERILRPKGATRRSITSSTPTSPERKRTTPVELGKEDFQDTIMRPDKDVVVEFYTPENASCKIVEPIYQSLAKEYEDSNTIIIARCNVREVPAKVYSVPTIKLFPAKAKYLPVEYYPDSGVSLEGYINFVEEERTHRVVDLAGVDGKDV